MLIPFLLGSVGAIAVYLILRFIHTDVIYTEIITLKEDKNLLKSNTELDQFFNKSASVYRADRIVFGKKVDTWYIVGNYKEYDYPDEHDFIYS